MDAGHLTYVEYSQTMTPTTLPTSSALEELLDILARLRHPVTGSPWEREQTYASIAPNTLEEAYEVVDAIRRDDMADLKSELGDLLLQVVFHSQIAREGGHFTFNEVAQSIVDKIKSRLPHFFAGRDVTVDRQLADWEAIKQAERDSKGYSSVLDGIAITLPALVRAQKIQSRVARVGFKWKTVSEVIGKIDEELDEVRQAVAENDPDHITEELGDLLGSVAILCDRLNIDAETALRNFNTKFETRFHHIEQRVTESGKRVENVELDELLSYWREAKHLKSA